MKKQMVAYDEHAHGRPSQVTGDQTPPLWTKEHVDRIAQATGKVLFGRIANRERFDACHDERALLVITSAIRMSKHSPSVVQHLEYAIAEGDLDLSTLLKRVGD